MAEQQIRFDDGAAYERMMGAWSKLAGEIFLDWLAPRPGLKWIDVGCGNGAFTALVAAYTAPAEIRGIDPSDGQLDYARLRGGTEMAEFVKGDAMALPFADNSLDLVTAAFGFRNLSNYAAGLVEIHRVLRPGGRIGILECNQPEGVGGALYNLYFHRVLPVAGGWISGSRAAYEWLPASVERFPRPPRMLSLMKEAGFADCAWDGYLLRAAGLYRGTKA